MFRILRPALAALVLLAVGCTFERRPAGEESGRADTIPLFAAADTAASGTPSSSTTADTATPDAPEAALVERAGAFFQGFQDARRSGRISEARSRIHPRALLLHGTRRLSPEDSDAELRRLLALEGRRQAPPSSIEEAVPVAAGVLFVVRYPPGGSAADTAVESVLLAPDSAGWSVRLLHRGVRSPD